MPRRATSLPLTLPPRSPDTAAYVWLYDTIREQVVNGRLEPGCRLPSTRDLARQFGLSRGTAVTAFEMLLAEGYIESTSGSGTRVSRALPRAWSTTPAAAVGGAGAAGAGYPARPGASSRFRSTRPLRIARSAPTSRRSICFRPRTGRAAARTFRNASASLLAGGDPLGYRPLRTAIAEYLAIARRGVRSPIG